MYVTLVQLRHHLTINIHGQWPLNIEITLQTIQSALQKSLNHKIIKNIDLLNVATFTCQTLYTTVSRTIVNPIQIWFSKVCHMLSWWTNNLLHSISICDTITKLLSFCSVYQVPSYQPNLTFLAPSSPKFAYLSIEVVRPSQE